jgi:hypothetical protein
MALQPIRQPSSYSPPWEPQILHKEMWLTTYWWLTVLSVFQSFKIQKLFNFQLVTLNSKMDALKISYLHSCRSKVRKWAFIRQRISSSVVSEIFT